MKQVPVYFSGEREAPCCLDSLENVEDVRPVLGPKALEHPVQHIRSHNVHWDARGLTSGV
jgi:hypothetical protein